MRKPHPEQAQARINIMKNDGQKEIIIACTVCSRPLANRLAFQLGGERRCLTCSLHYRLLLKRSFLTALVVGTLLTVINQGPLLFSGHFPPDLWWKLPLTYLVPFCVATWSALSNSKLLISHLTD